MGYHWGGDGKTRMIVDLHDFSADLHDLVGQLHKKCLTPCNGDVYVRLHSPKQRGSKESTIIACSFSEICLVSYLKQAKVLRNCISKLQCLMQPTSSEAPSDRTPFRPSLLQCHVEGGALKLKLEDDREIWHTETVFNAAVTDYNLHYRSEQRIPNIPTQTQADFNGALQVGM